LFHLGPEGLSDGELLAVLLRIGKSGQSAEDLGRQLLTQFKGISGIDRAHIEEFLDVPGTGRLDGEFARILSKKYERLTERRLSPHCGDNWAGPTSPLVIFEPFNP
jgi:DNA repair protein RadC